MGLDFELFEITHKIGFLVPVLMLACGIFAVVKLPGAPAKVFAGLAFLVLLFEPMMFLAAQILEPDVYYAVYEIVPGPVFFFTALLGWALLLVGLILVRRTPAGTVPAAAAPRQEWSGEPPAQAAVPPTSPVMGPGGRPLSTVSTASPGWGLASAYVVLAVVSFLTGILLLGLVIEAGGRINDDEAIAIAIAACVWMLVGIPAVVIYLIWLYKTWDAVPEAYRSATPGAAVGFLFIPFFNYYWVFRAIPGLSASIRRAREAKNPHAAGGAGFGVGVTACILGLIPYVGVIAAPFFLIWVLVANGAKNRMLEEQQY